ncbi:hypothetical protein GCM10025734_09590 [Kitasatospora paranensis]|uniref:hypothetical protein n=1 Tax=Kitasatospora paranensis TaxID=258053 RepID=UPI0031E64CE7
MLNGTDGVNQVAAGIVSQGLAILQSLQHQAAPTGTTSPASATADPNVNGRATPRLPNRS